MNKKGYVEFKEKIKDLPLWKLIILSSYCEKTMIEKKKAGMKNMSSLKKIRNVRSIYRKLILEKLKLWEKGEDVDDMNFSDLLDYDEFNDKMEYEMK